MAVTKREMDDTRFKFHQLAKQAYPDVGEPGTVWVLIEVLGWTWEDCTKTAVEGFSREGYRIFQLDAEGKRILADDGYSIKTVYRKWTSEEKRKLRDWWWLLGY